MKQFVRQSPTRIDFAGGTLDCWPLYLMVGQAMTINLSIDILTSAQLKIKSDPSIAISLKDLDYHKDFSSLSELLDCKDEALDLIRAHINYWKPKFGFELSTSSQSPVGGGLGGSSSLSMSLIDVFLKASEKELKDLDKVILARDIEAQVLKKPTGTQDYFPSFLSGINAIHYEPGSMRVEPLPVDLDLVDKSLSLIYTGKPHHSGINNWSVIREVFDGNKDILSALVEVKQVTEDLYAQLKAGDLSHIPEIFKRELAARERLSSKFSSPEIKRLTDVSLRAGADAVKICGAGGGGCVAIWSTPDKKGAVEEACQKEGFQTLSMSPVLKPFKVEVQV